jgi:hypothetical protein
MRAQIGDCPQRNDAQVQHRYDPFCLDLVRLDRPRRSALPVLRFSAGVPA